MIHNLLQHHDNNQLVMMQPLTVGPETRLSDVVVLMSGAHSGCDLLDIAPDDSSNAQEVLCSSCVLVLDGQALVGLLTERDLIRLTAAEADLENMPISHVMVRQIVTLNISQAQDVMSLARQFRMHQIRHLPIVNDQGHLLGLITPNTVRQMLQPIDFLKLHQVADVMATQIICAAATVSLLELTQLMANHHVSCVVITHETADGILPVGVVSERDVVQFRALELDLKALPAAAVMSTLPVCLRPTDKIWTAREVMEQRRLRHIVITTEQGYLAGLLTQTSLLKALDPVELHSIINLLNQKVDLLETERTSLLRKQNLELEQEVQTRTTELQHQLERDRLINEMALKIRQSLNLEEILNVAVTQGRQLLKTDRVLIYQFAADMSGTIVSESCRADLPSSLGAQITDTYFQSISNSPYQQGYKQIVNDVYNAGLTDCHLDLLKRFQIRANAVVPIITEQTLWGLLVAHDCSAPRHWQASDLDLLEQLSVHLAIAIRQAELHQQIQAELTERQQTESVLAASEERFRQLVTHIPSVVYRCRHTAEWQGMYISEAIAKLTGYPASDFAAEGGRTFVSIMHPDDVDKTNYLIELALQAKQSFSVEYRIIYADGRVLWVQDQGQGIFDPQDNLLWIDGVIFDISQRKQAEAALVRFNRQLEAKVQERTESLQVANSLLQQEIAQRQSVERSLRESQLCTQLINRIISGRIDNQPIEDILSTVLQQIHEAFAKFRVRYCSINLQDQLETQISLQPPSMTDCTLMQFNMQQAPAYLAQLRAGQPLISTNVATEAVLAPLAQALQSLEIQAMLAVPISYSNQLLGLLSLTAPDSHQWSDYEIDTVLEIADYLTFTMQGIESEQRRQQYEAVLAANEQKLYAVFNQAFQFAGILTPDGTVLDVNQTALDFGGFELKDVVNRPFWETYWWQISPATQNQLKRAIAQAASGTVVRYEVDVWGADDTIATIDFSIKPVLDEAGKVTLLIPEGRNISDRKQIEAELVQKTDTLARFSTNLKQLHRLNIIRFNKIEEKYQEYLQTACRIFNFSTGIISRIEQQTYVIEAVYSDLGSLQRGAILDLKNTYCAVVVQQCQTVTYRHVGDDPVMQNHPSCKKLNLQSYIGTPIFVDGDVYGTLCLASSEIRHQDFNEHEREIIELMAQSLGRAISAHKTETRRQQAESDLRCSEERWQLAIDGINHGVFDVDVATNKAFFSPRWLEILGYSPENIVNNNTAWSDRIHPDDLDRVMAAQEAYLTQQSPAYGVEYRLRCKDGSYKWVMSQMKALWDEHNRPIRLIGSMGDISDRRSAELALRDSEERFRVLATAAPVGIFQTDPEGACLFVNDRWLELTGLSDQDAMGDGWIKAVHLDDRSAVFAEWQGAIEQEREFVLEYRFQQSNGTVVWVVGRAIALQDEASTVTGYLGTVMNISDRKQAEERLQQQLAAVAAARDGIAILKDGHYVYLNQAHAQIFGYDSADELIAKTWQCLYQDEVVETIEQTIFPVLAEHGTWQGELTAQKRDGSTFVEDLSLTLTARDTLVCVCRDVTARKQIELALRDSEERLQIALESARMGSWDWDMQNNHITWSESMEQLIGPQFRTLSNDFETLRGMIHPDDIDRVSQTIQQTIEQHQDYQCEYRVLRADSSVCWVNSKGRLWYDPTGQPIRMTGISVDITDSKQVEAERMRLFDMLAASLNEIYIFDAETWQFQYVNPSALQNLGYDLESMKSMTPINIKPELTAEQFQQLVVPLSQCQKDKIIFQTVHQRSDGSLYPVEVHLQLIQRLDERVFLAVISDITERQKSERAIQQSTALLQGISTAQEQFIVDSDPRILFDELLNTVLELTGSTYSFISEVCHTNGNRPTIETTYMKVKGKPAIKSHAIKNLSWSREPQALNSSQSPELSDLTPILTHIITTGKSIISNHPVTALPQADLPDECLPLQSFSGIPLYVDKKMVGIVGLANRLEGYDQALNDYLSPFLYTCSNIIDAFHNDQRRQEVEKELQQSEANYRSVVNSIREVIFQVNLAGEFTFLNPAWTDITGFEVEDSLGQTVLTYIKPDDQILGQTKMQDLLTCAVAECRCELRFKTALGDYRWIEAFARSIVDDSGKMLGIAGTFNDITHRRRAEAETLLMLEKEKDLNQLKTSFITTTSHEFRTPLSIISSNAGILQSYSDRLDETKKQKHLNRIQTSVKHMTQMLEDVLFISTAEAEKLKCQPEWLNFSEFCSDIVDTMQMGCDSHTIVFHKDAGLYAWTDSRLMQQVITNLIGNAIKYSPDANTVYVSLKAQGAKLLQLEVQDQGIGIPLSDQKRLFESFQRASNVGDIPGTGLGLSVVRKCIDLHQGTITVSSSANSGTTFTVTLPRCELRPAEVVG